MRKRAKGLSLQGKAYSEVPYDWWGLSIEEVKKLVTSCGHSVRLTNLKYRYRGERGDFQIDGMTNYRIVATSKKALQRCLTLLHDFKREKEHPTPEQPSIFEKPKTRRKKMGGRKGCL